MYGEFDTYANVFSHVYKGKFDGFHPTTQRQIRELVEYLPDHLGSGLECCAGTGEWIQEMEKRCSFVLAVEVNPLLSNSIVTCNPNTQVLTGNYISEDFYYDRYELVVCNPPFKTKLRNGLYVYTSIAWKALRQTKKGGFLILAEHPLLRSTQDCFWNIREKLKTEFVPIGSVKHYRNHKYTVYMRVKDSYES